MSSATSSWKLTEFNFCGQASAWDVSHAALVAPSTVSSQRNRSTVHGAADKPIDSAVFWMHGIEGLIFGYTSNIIY